MATSQEEVRSLIETNYEILLRIARSKAPGSHVVRYRYSKHECTAEDIVHTVTMKLLARWRSVPREPSGFRAYAVRAIRNGVTTPLREHCGHVEALRRRGLLGATHRSNAPEEENTKEEENG